MRRIRFNLTVVLIVGLICIAIISRNLPAYAASEPLESQIAQTLIEESANGKIKVGILDFTISLIGTDKKLSDSEIKDMGTQIAEEYTASLLQKIKDAGKHDVISIIERSRLDEILKEKKLQVTGLTEQTASEIGGIAGLDVIIIGSYRVIGDNWVATAKLVRVKDGEILAVAEQKPNNIIASVENLKARSWKSLPLNLTNEGNISVTIKVVRGNPVDVFIILSKEIDRFKRGQKIVQFSNFAATKTKYYKRSAYLDKGNYYLILRDRTLGVLSSQSSDIKVLVQM